MERIIPQTQDMFDAYGRLNGDNDILHYDPEYARKRGFRGTLGHGLMYLAYVADLAARKYGKDWHYRGEISVKFIAPVCPGDELKVSLDDEGQAQCESQFGKTLVGYARLI
ncbi:MaoC family dehydratase [Pigmentiphaga sp.]|jgi:Acyl dehydratase|uniref:MaoC family dehydratase n=1 Tax=Pigmentiphaga sp. TaxID=1977564 RepID=UPI0025CC29C1|nr:MaoC family dehydratase [Pigmentiphaga sp.]MBX6317082.1 MaoC family dehydratase [Pigmentiphaga sp.]